MCPFFVFIDGGRRFQCSLCGASSTVPQEYFAHLDHTGRRIDAFQRPELCLGSYEVVATAEYCKDNTLPLPPAYIFLLDVSAASVRSGLVNLFCSRFITDILPHLPRLVPILFHLGLSFGLRLNQLLVVVLEINKIWSQGQ